MSHRRILVVDDDRTMVKTLCDILALHGWAPQGVHSGFEAIAATETGSFPVALMDVRMPGIDGVTAMRTIKEKHPAMRVLLMTAHAATDLIHEARRHGAAHVITKPIEMSGLLALLR